MNIYEEYENSKNDSTQDKITFLNKLLSEYPKLIDYLYNRIDTCFGKHIVYVVHLNVDGNDMIKIGYTKNSVLERFSEKRWKGVDVVSVVNVLRENTLQAKGAQSFEKDLKSKCSNYTLKTNLTLPGKNEMMDIKYTNQILTLYDNLFNQYQNIIGLKPPN
jgi:hypothetical protein